MTERKTTVKKSVGSSWISSIFLSLIIGIIGGLITHSWEGFLAGFVMTLMIALISMIALVPFAGIFLYWSWANWFCDWFLTAVGFSEAFAVLKWIPLIFCLIFGIFTWILMTVLTILVILAILIKLV